MVQAADGRSLAEITARACEGSRIQSTDEPADMPQLLPEPIINSYTSIYSPNACRNAVRRQFATTAPGFSLGRRDPFSEGQSLAFDQNPILSAG